MSKSRSLTQAATLEFYRVALTNAKSNPKIMEILTQNGLSEEILEEGSNLLSIAREASNSADLKRTQLSETYKSYSKVMAVIEERFLTDRKKADMAFLNDEEAQDKLNLNTRFDRSYVKMIGIIRNFYTTLSEDQSLAEQLGKFGLSQEKVNSMLASIAELEDARANFINEKGISQDATNAKKKAFSDLNKWMSRFLAFTKTALKHQPQLMESFSVVVKN
jgi:hypothetical protein